MVLKLILASKKLSELEQFEIFSANNQLESRDKSKNDKKIKLMPLPSIKKRVCGWGEDVLAVKLNSKWGQFS